MGYRINALSFTLTRKCWKVAVAVLILIIIYQRLKYKKEIEEVRNDLP